MPNPEKFTKHDENKPNISLVPTDPIEWVAKVFMHGAKKYKIDNWKLAKTESELKQYYSALMRHIFAWIRGHRIDPESGLPHLAHAACNIFILLYLTESVNIKKTPKTPKTPEIDLTTVQRWKNYTAYPKGTLVSNKGKLYKVKRAVPAKGTTRTPFYANEYYSPFKELTGLTVTKS